MTLIVRERVWLKVALASASACLAALTVFRPDWIEAVTGLDPDRRSGALEAALAVGFLLLSLSFGAAARAERRRRAVAPIGAGG